MKTIGLLGGMSWESTVPYYATINRQVARRLGGLHSAKIVLISVDFHEIERLQASGDWDRAGTILADHAQSLQRAGADFLVLCTNTLHRVASTIEQAVSLPLLHVADATAEAIRRRGLQRVALIGTQYTMEQEFYRGRLRDRHGLEVLTPDHAQRTTIQRVIYDELCRGQVHDRSRIVLREMIGHLQAQNAQGVILGCTELGMLVGDEDWPIPLFDTTQIHACAAAEFALEDASGTS